MKTEDQKAYSKALESAIKLKLAELFPNHSLTTIEIQVEITPLEPIERKAKELRLLTRLQITEKPPAQ